MPSRERNRIVWCTPGVWCERELLDGVRAAGWTVSRTCIDAADVLAAVSIEPESIVVVSSAISRVDPALWSQVCTTAAAVHVLRGGFDAPLPDGPCTEVEVTDESTLDALLAALGRAEPDGGSAPGVGRIVVTWGTGGAPGRTTIALALAEACARMRVRTCMIDADTYAPSVAESIAVVEQSSGVLLACKHAEQRSLDEASLARALRTVAPRLDLLTGIDDPTRWPEMRAESFRQVLALCRRMFEITVVDVHSCVETTSDPVTAMRGERNGIAVATLQAADHVFVVARPDPVGTTRLVRTLTELTRTAPGTVPTVVVNRSTKRSDEAEVQQVLSRLGRQARVVRLPEDAAVARALARGSLLGESRHRSAVRTGMRRVARQLTATGVGG